MDCCRHGTVNRRRELVLAGRHSILTTAAAILSLWMMQEASSLGLMDRRYSDVWDAEDRQTHIYYCIPAEGIKALRSNRDLGNPFLKYAVSKFPLEKENQYVCHLEGT